MTRAPDNHNHRIVVHPLPSPRGWFGIVVPYAGWTEQHCRSAHLNHDAALTEALRLQRDIFTGAKILDLATSAQ